MQFLFFDCQDSRRMLKICNDGTHSSKDNLIKGYLLFYSFYKNKKISFPICFMCSSFKNLTLIFYLWQHHHLLFYFIINFSNSLEDFCESLTKSKLHKILLKLYKIFKDLFLTVRYVL